MLTWFAQTTLIVAALAALALLAGRACRLGPEARHALWLVVLAKFLIPPVVAWPWPLPATWTGPEPAPAGVAVVSAPPAPPLPADPGPVDLGPMPPEFSEQEPAGAGAGGEPGPERLLVERAAPENRDRHRSGTAGASPIFLDHSAREETAPAVAGPPPEVATPSARWPGAILAAWLCGTVVVLARLAWRAARFRRSLVGSAEDPAWLVAEAAALGERLGVRPPPILLALEGATPLLWCLGRPRLIVPAPLVDRLARDRWPGILAHELAHLARRDHWVVRLELLAEAIWWWNPLFWFVRGRLHAEAELACDARVVRALPAHRFAYAEALVEVCERMNRPATPAPALGVGGPGAARSLEARLIMILRDPIPRRPRSRRAALAIALLAALALPTWTLGQQQPPPPDASKPSDALKTAPPPVATDPATATPAPAAMPLTLDAIREGVAKRLAALKTVEARFVVWDRHDLSRSQLWAFDQPNVNPPPGRVEVQVAELVADLANGGKGRLDAVAALPGFPDPDGGRPGWTGLVEIRNEAEKSSLLLGPKLKGPVPFVWRAVNDGEPFGVGKDFYDSIFVNGGLDMMGPGRPYRPPLMIGDLGPLGALADPAYRFSLAGVETVDGHDTVRLAWVTKQRSSYRGLVWIAPDLGFAVVRFETVDHQKNLRHAHRSKSEAFARVEGLWIAHLIKTRSTKFDKDRSILNDHEQVVQVENLKLNRSPADLPLGASLPILGIDEKSGEFLTPLPEVPPGLFARLAQAVRESPFGPPAAFEREAPKPPMEAPAPEVRAPRPDQNRPAEATKSLVEAKEAPAAADVIAPKPMPSRPAGPPTAEAPKAEAKPQDDPNQPRADPEAAALFAQVVEWRALYDGLLAKEPAPRPDDLDVLYVRAKYDDLVARYVKLREAKQAEGRVVPPAVPMLDEAKDQAGGLIRRRLLANPKVGALLKEMIEVEARLVEVRSKSRNGNDPATIKARKQFQRIEGELTALLDARSWKVLDEPAQADTPADRVALLQIRRDGKAAEVRKAEAQVEMVRTEVSQTAKMHEKKYVGDTGLSMAQGKLSVAEAELAVRKADLAEADLFLDQAKRRAASADPKPPAVVTGVTTTAQADAPPSLLDARDAVELLEIQLAAKQAEADEESKLVSYAKFIFVNVKAGDVQGRNESQKNMLAATARANSKSGEVKELAVRLKQARRRLEAEEGLFRRSSSPGPPGR